MEYSKSEYSGYLIQGRLKKSHAYVSYRIVGVLSKKIWGVEYETDLACWKKVAEEIKVRALELYEEYDMFMAS